MRLIKLAMLLLVSAFTLNTAVAQEANNAPYKNIVPPQPTSTGAKIEVIEIFSYGCSHCFRFEATLERWLKDKPANVEFVRLPAIFSPQLAIYARAYYAAEALGAIDKVHKPLFDAIHMEKRKLATEDEIAEVFVANGVKKEDFHKAFRSFSTEAKVRRAQELGKRYGVEATPSMVVNGKYITNPGMANIGFDGMINQVNQLAAKESKGG
jgi:thiol:disulfide interchange protein DsbA